jgi:LuxR family transcriptional regulator, maltose regulon positive regulatory protein
MTESEFTLKAMPPRLPREALERPRLQRTWDQVHDRAAIVVAAPAGFGKTTLLLQWRRRWMENGALVAWLDADDQDEPERFTMALLHSLRTASGRPIDPAAQCTIVSGLEALTSQLSEIAMRGTQMVLMIDDSERLPETAVRSVLQYLLMNAPANLHVVIGTRVPLPLQTAELTAKCNYAALSAEDLRLTLAESMEVLERRLGARLDADHRAHLHETTEGWPIGLQLAIAAIEHEADPAAAVRELSARHGTLQDYFVETLLSRMPARVAQFLTRVAILDPLSVALCEAATGDAQSGEHLEWLVRETPMVMVGERSDCVRLHPMARDFLLGRFEQLPREERDALHVRAAHWFAREERFHEAANHALAAGDVADAEAWAAKSLWALSTRGQLAEAREWLERLPHALFAGDAQLRLVAASVFAFSDRNAEAQHFARTVLDDPKSGEHDLAVALRIAAGVAAYADQLDEVPLLLPRWPKPGDAGAAPLYLIAGLNVRALLALHAGETVQAREYLAEAAAHGDAPSLRLAAGLGRMLLGLSHLWDGDAYQAEAVLRPALIRAERDEGRRSLRACLLAAVLAEALLQGGQPEAAQGLLANRIDVLERCGLPDALLCAYRTLASLALSQGDERRALGVLDDLCSLAERRQLPRLRVHALAEQVRIHALRGRTETIAQRVEDLDAMRPVFQAPPLRWFQPQFRLAVAIAKAYAALAHYDFDGAEAQLGQADALARQQRRGHDMLTTKVLRAVVARQRDADHALPLLAEALSLAQLSGNTRLLANAPASASDLADELRASGSGAALRLIPRPAPHAPSLVDPVREQRAPMRNALLTSKEWEILQLLQKGMSNKQIARTLDVSGETVKWHLKNLFLKLSAGTRQHVVDRARLLGIVQ